MPEVSLGPSPLHAQVSAEVFELFRFSHSPLATHAGLTAIIGERRTRTAEWTGRWANAAGRVCGSAEVARARPAGPRARIPRLGEILHRSMQSVCSATGRGAPELAQLVRVRARGPRRHPHEWDRSGALT